MNTVSENFHIAWNGDRTKAPNRSGVYWEIFPLWWQLFPLRGNGLLIGDEYPEATALKKWFQDKHPMIENIVASSLENSDMDWDITHPLEKEIRFDWIICQAVLEHVKDPVAAVKNLGSVLNHNGLLFLHSHGPEFKEHRHPIDCYRFMRDGVIALLQLAKLELVDILWTSSHWFALSRKVEI